MAIVFEHDTGTALVRIHSGKLSKEEWEDNLRKSTLGFFHAMRPDLERHGLLDKVSRTVNT